jgi:hypothetical protein
MTNLLRPLLTGGDRRSQARSASALKIVTANPSRVAELAELAEDDDWLVAMRAVDLLEKLAHDHPEWVAPHKALFLGPLADSDKWEIRLQIVRALPFFTWSPAERRHAVEILRRDVDYPQTFVRAWALDSLSIFAQHDATLAPIVRRVVNVFEASGSKALAARARHVRERLASRATARQSGSDVKARRRPRRVP